MDDLSAPSNEAAAHALALLVAADACVARGKLQRLDRLDAYVDVGVSRDRFLELAVACAEEIGEGVVAQSWLPEAQIERIDRILDAVADMPTRQRVCELAAAAIDADGVNEAERLLYEHALGRWRLSPPVVHAWARAA